MSALPPNKANVCACKREQVTACELCNVNHAEWLAESATHRENKIVVEGHVPQSYICIIIHISWSSQRHWDPCIVQDVNIDQFKVGILSGKESKLCKRLFVSSAAMYCAPSINQALFLTDSPVFPVSVDRVTVPVAPFKSRTPVNAEAPSKMLSLMFVLIIVKVVPGSRD